MKKKPRIRVGTSGGYALPPTAVSPLRPKAAYLNGGRSPFFWDTTFAGLREEREDVRASYVETAARTIDAMHNSGWLSGAVDQSIASTIGTGLRLAARPDRVALGWDAQMSDEWCDKVERRWTTYAGNKLECDVAGKANVPAQQAQVLKHTFNFGEALALLPFVKRPFNMNGTKSQLLPPTRLVQDDSLSLRMYQGVTTDSYGLPIAYRIQQSAENHYSKDIRARDGVGRPQVAHIFEGQPGQMRGITPLAPALRTVKKFDKLADITLQAALIQTLFSATLEGSAPTEEIMRALQSEEEQEDEKKQGLQDFSMDGYISARGAWYDNTKIDVGGNSAASRVVHLFPGEKLMFNRSEHPNSNYSAFAKFLLLEIARCLGMTFETLSGDYTGATYSSIRMATSEIWPIIMRRREIAANYSQMMFEAWLEEEIEQGHIPFPNGLFGFLANRPAAVLADWRGPAKPQADDLKTAKAHQIYKQMGIMSDERIADELGYDIADEYERRSREMKLRETLGLPEHDTMLPPPDLADEADEPAPRPRKKEPA